MNVLVQDTTGDYRRENYCKRVVKAANARNEPLCIGSLLPSSRSNLGITRPSGNKYDESLPRRRRNVRTAATHRRLVADTNPQPTA